LSLLIAFIASITIFGILLLLLPTTYAAPSHLRPTQLHTVLLHPNLFKTSLFTASQEVSISLKSFPMTSSHPVQELIGQKTEDVAPLDEPNLPGDYNPLAIISDR
jgi:hypothetical protein